MARCNFSTPDHMHVASAIMAIKMGKHGHANELIDKKYRKF